MKIITRQLIINMQWDFGYSTKIHFEFGMDFVSILVIVEKCVTRGQPETESGNIMVSKYILIEIFLQKVGSRF